MSKGTKYILIIVGSLLLTIAGVIAGFTLWLTPERLTRIVNEEGSRCLTADVRASRVDYTFWSTFPTLHVTIDSLSIDSHTLDNISEMQRKTLPSGASRLLSTGRIAGSINLWRLLRGEVSLRDIEVATPSLNLVTVNDSTCNFSIFPTDLKVTKIPHISFNTIKVIEPVKLNWMDISKKAKAQVTVRNAEIKMREGETDTYTISMDGKAEGQFGEEMRLADIPVSIAGKIALRFNPFTLDVTDLHADAASIRTLSSFTLIASKKMILGKLHLDFSCPNIAGIPDIIHTPLALPEGTEISMPLDASLDLREPYEIPTGISSHTPLPPLTLSVNVPNGNMTYSGTNGKPISVGDIMLHADLYLTPDNPDNSSIVIPAARFSTDGATVNLSAEITDIFSGNPFIETRLKCHSDLARTSKALSPGTPMKVRGSLDGGMDFSCRVSDLRNPQIKDISLNGTLKSASLRLADAASGMSASLKNLSLKFDGSLPGMSPRELQDAGISLAATSSWGRLSFGASSSLFTFSGASADIAASLLKSPTKIPTYPDVPTSSDDSILSARIKHTPLYLTASVNPIIQGALGYADILADIRIDEGLLETKAYPSPNRISRLHLSTNLDSVAIHSLEASTRHTAARISGTVSGLRPFLISSSPTRLGIDLDAHFDDVDINELCGTYYAGRKLTTGQTVSYTVPSLGPYTASDSLCVLIPRNIRADIRLHSDKAEYMQWSFSPLSTRITLRDGVATLGDLSIGSDFCDLTLDWTYSTADLNDIFMKLHANIDDFDLHRFFLRFPMLTESAPEIENLSGKLHADADGKLLMFPNMFLNAPSMTASAAIGGEDLAFDREGKIRRITHLMLIGGDEPLEIDSLGIHASFHDNLLQVDPFDIDCGPYRLSVAGVNNLQNDMYYHIGIHRSPLHLPFGVNIVGNRHHPSIRLGGAGINPGREREISSSLSDDVDINIMRELKHGWLLFVNAAAKYDYENNHQYFSDVY